MIENNQLKKQEIKRPWQGTAFIVVSSIIILGGILLLFIIGLNKATIYLVSPLIILFIFLSIGFYKGFKMVVILTIILMSFSLFGIFLSFIKNELENFNGIFLSFFLLYLSISCLQHPFYNQKKTKQ